MNIKSSANNSFFESKPKVLSSAETANSPTEKVRENGCPFGPFNDKSITCYSTVFVFCVC